eukprot:CAMPEP_0170556592 /NCGR_PEP_ID=MMETSP0211-20121228/17676_1 /TAXON_ID=311385 /ORGANISM="Pseudokeronopsis sp., Strain OXSARD2" /LENGTH=107 /DNA_ID=CAMNT_0010867025 /DNA_START=1 /DNA_END=324 /DNA_ORIENTATION=+
MESSAQANEIKYISIGRTTDAAILLTHASDNTKKAYAEEYKKEAEEILSNLKSSGAYADLRDQTESLYGNWFITCDKNLYAFCVLTDSDFKTSQAYLFLRELQVAVY